MLTNMATKNQGNPNTTQMTHNTDRSPKEGCPDFSSSASATTVKLLGELGRRFGRVHHFHLSTHAEAFKALAANFPDFWGYLLEASDRGIGYKAIASSDSTGFVYLDEKSFNFPSMQTLIIAPVPCGSGGVGRIIAGAALIGLAGPLGGLGILGLTATNFTLVGAALLLSGVSQLLSPVPKAPKTTEDKSRNSFLFNGVTNTSAPGYPIAIVYGQHLVGSSVISSGITTSQIS